MARFVPIMIQVQGGRAGEREVRQITNAFKQMNDEAEQSAQASSSSFTKYLGAEFFGNLARDAFQAFKDHAVAFVRDSIALAQELQNALKGVGSIGDFYGIAPGVVEKRVTELEAVKLGMLSVGDATRSVKPLLQFFRGDVDKAVEVVDLFSRSAAFGRQAALGYGEAIVSASEGLKNMNPITMDNAGVTRNASLIMKDYGLELQDLDDKLKGNGAREKLVLGLRKEVAGQMDDLTKMSETYSGSIAVQDKAYQDLQRSLGELIITHPALVESNKLVAEQLNDTTKELMNQDSESAKFVRNAVYYYALIKANIAPFGAFMLNLAKATFYGLDSLYNNFFAVIQLAVGATFNVITKAAVGIANVVIGVINKVTELARRLPAELGGPIGLLQKIGPLQPYELQTDFAKMLSRPYTDRARSSDRGFYQAIEGMKRASDEGLEVDRRILWEFNANEHRRWMERRGRELGLVQEESTDGLARARELADAAGGGGAGGGRAKKIADDLKFLSNAVPVPTPADPGLKAMIEDYAQVFGIPSWVAFAQIWAESRFNPKAMSPKQAKGLTQITPGTAQQYGISYKDLTDPEVALKGWGKIMASLYAKYNNWDLALLAYHQGEGPVDRLVAILQSSGGEPPGGFTAAAQRAGIGPQGRAYLTSINAFKSNPLAPAEPSVFQGMLPAAIVNSVLRTDLKGQPRLLETDSDVLAQLPVALERQWEKFYSDVEQRERQLKERREDLNAEYRDRYRSLVVDIGNLELDLLLIRMENADKEFVQQRRKHLALSEELDLLRQIALIEDEIATGPLNQSLRIQLALLQDIASIRRRDEEAIKEQHRAQLELAEANTFHAEQARAIVLGHLAQSRSQTEIFADAIIDTYESINDAVLNGVQRLTGGIKVVDNLIAGLITRLTSRLFQKLLDMLIPPSGAGGIGGIGIGVPGGGGGSGGGFFSNLFSSVFRPQGGGGLGQFVTPGFAGGPGAGQFLGGLGGFGGIGVPASASANAAGVAQLQQIAQLAGGGGALGSAAAGAVGVSGPSSMSLGLTGSLLAALPLAGAAFGIQSWIGAFKGNLSSTQALFGSGILGFIVNRTIQRRKEETIREDLSQRTISVLKEILAESESGRLTLSAATAQFEALRVEYFKSVDTFRDSKTKRIATDWWYKPEHPPQVFWQKIQLAATAGEQAQKFTSTFIPTFATGGVFNSDYFIPRAARGLLELPGVFDRRDDLLMRVSRGERVAVMTPEQYRRIGGRRTFEAAGVPALATGGSSADSSLSPRSQDSTTVIALSVDASGLVARAVRTPEGRQAIVRAMNEDARINGRDGYIGTVEVKLTER